jgi:hypothetical protein
MSYWQAILFQSNPRPSSYDEASLPTQNWRWPQETWFQTRLGRLRKLRAQMVQQRTGTIATGLDGSMRANGLSA